MIHYFPNIHQDELLYSLIVRYHAYSGNSDVRSTLYELFDEPKIRITPDLPADLSALYDNTKHFKVWNGIEELLGRHTLYHYFTAFNSEIENKVKDALVNSKSRRSANALLGLMASSVKQSTYIKYCPICEEEDLINFGISYWRIHFQLPSVLVCTKHEVMLENSDIHFRSKNSELIFPPINMDTSYGIRKIDDKVKDHLIFLSHESEQLLSGEYKYDLKQIYQLYRKLLQHNGFLSSNGKVYQQKLAENFLNYYGGELLQLLQSSIDINNESCWLKGITRKLRKSIHPIRHLLFIKFLGASLETLGNIRGSSEPFGKGPFPCLNPVCPNYNKLVISNITITRCDKDRKPIGTFKCDCGFVYSRKGPDNESEDLYRKSRVKKYGSLWVDAVKYKIHNEKMSYRQCAKMLGADTNTIIKYANLNDEIETIPTNKVDINLVSSKKNEWLTLMKKYPDKSKTELRKMNPALFTWLYRHEKDWLNSHSPVLIKRRSNKSNRVDWKSRDQEIALMVKGSIDTLLNQSPPKRITTRSIGLSINKLSLLEKHVDKLPITQDIILSHAETVFEFQCRRVQWAIKKIMKNGESLQAWRVRRIAGIKDLNERIYDYIINEIEKC